MKDQLALIDRPPAFDTRIARRRDPPSSSRAANFLMASGAVESQRAQVLRLVQRWPGLTSRELAKKGKLERHLVARRTSDLESRGVIRKGKLRACSIGKTPAVEWLPVEP